MIVDDKIIDAAINYIRDTEITTITGAFRAGALWMRDKIEKENKKLKQDGAINESTIRK